MKKVIDWLKDNELGQGTIEYSLILVIISVAFILLLSALGTTLYDKYIAIGNTMP